MRLFAFSAAIICCALCTTVLILADKDGWGWLVFIAVILGLSM